MSLGAPTPGVEERVRIDLSTRAPVILAFVSALVWLIAGTAFGDIASLKFHFPDWLASQPWSTLGRIRTAHLNAVVYGWASLGLLGVAIWLVPRLVHQELAWGRLTRWGLGLWNAGVVAGVAGILAGRTTGLEWLEMDRLAAVPFLIAGGGLVAASLLRTLVLRRAEHLYVSIWYMIGALLWFPLIYVPAILPIYRGVESAAVNWFYAHNALGFWLTALSLGAIYYLIPKVLGRPIFSYQLSLVGFWALAFFYALNGMHHLIGGPLPTWMVTTSIAASMMMVIPTSAVAINHHSTMIGRFRALRFSPSLRFIVLGAMAYTAVSFQGIYTALVKVNRLTHFTHWTVAHSHMGVYTFVTFVVFGSMYYVFPRLVGREWPSARLITWHFWLVLSGIALYVTGLSFGGVFQGLALADPAQPFEASHAAAAPWLWVRTISGGLLTAGHLVFAWHVWRMLRGNAARPGLPAWHGVVPMIVEPAAADGRPA